MSITIVERPRVLSEEQCARVIERHRAGLQPSTVVGRSRSFTRICSSAKIAHGDLLPDVAESIFKAVHLETGARRERFEPWELLHYTAGGRYLAHVDWFPDRHAFARENGGQRTHSVIVYLSAAHGGETFFPKLRVRFVPKPGTFLLWNNLVDGVPSHDATHEARAVKSGEKWALVTWVRERAFVAGETIG